MNTGKLLTIERISKKYGSFTALDSVSLEIAEGEFVTLLGPSGCGKSTMIRLIAGFENPSSGDIKIDGQSMRSVPPSRRPIGIVFQTLALFPHMTVFENIAFGLKMRGDADNEIKDAVEKLLSMMNLSDLGGRYINQISGGQRQRVALARAIVIKPRVLLLDEPLSALDKNIRRQMQLELKKIQRAIGTTFIFVTHDQEEAMVMSDRIVVMNQGKVDQIGTPNQVYNKPQTYFGAGFVGEMNFFDCSLKNRKGRDFSVSLTGFASDIIVNSNSESAMAENILNKWLFCLRPEQLYFSDEIVRNSTPGIVKQKIEMGSIIRYLVDVNTDNFLMISSINAPNDVKEGDRVHIVFPENGGNLVARA